MQRIKITEEDYCESLDLIQYRMLMYYSVVLYQEELGSPHLLDILKNMGSLKVYILVRTDVPEEDLSLLHENKIDIVFDHCDNMHFEPNVYIDYDDRKWFPIYTHISAIPNELRHCASIIKVSGLKALVMAQSFDGVCGLAFNYPFNEVFIPLNIAKIMLRLTPYDYGRVDDKTELFTLIVE